MGAVDVMKHPFFEGVNWKKVLEKSIKKVPWKPEIKDEEDTKHFDDYNENTRSCPTTPFWTCSEGKMGGASKQKTLHHVDSHHIVLSVSLLILIFYMDFCSSMRASPSTMRRI